MAGNEGWRAAAQRAGQAVLARRVELGHRTRGDFAEVVGLTVKTLGEVERGERRSYNRNTYAALDQALQWPIGRFERLLRGDADSPDDDDPPSWLSTREGIYRHIFRDEVPLVELLHRSGLDDAAKLRIIFHIRLVRERHNVDLLGDVAERIRAAGGWAPDQPYPPLWLAEDDEVGRS